MSLQKTNVSYNFTKGIDTKTDEYQISGKLSEIENGVFQTTGAVRKRNGYEEIGLTSGLASGNSIAAYQNEVIAMDGKNLYSYIDSKDSFNNKGSKIAVDVSRNAIVKNNYAQYTPYSAYHSSGLKFFCWYDSSGTNYGEVNAYFYSIIDKNTGASIVSNAHLIGQANPVNAFTFGNYFVFVYIDITDLTASTFSLKYITIPISAPQSPNAPVTIATDVKSTQLCDAIVFNNNIYVVYANDVNQLAMFYLNSSFVKSTVYTISANSDLTLTMSGDSSTNRIWICYYETGADLKYFIRDSTLATSILAPTLITNGDQPSNISIYARNGVAKLFMQQSTPITTPALISYFVKYADLDTAGLSNVYSLLRDVTLYSRIFYYNGNYWAVVLHESYLQSTYFLVNDSGFISARLVPSNGGPNSFYKLTNINQLDTNVFNISIIERDNITSIDKKLVYDTGVTEEIITFKNQIDTQSIANNLHLTGGTLDMYDGLNVCEHGFFLYPENLGLKVLPYGGAIADTGANGSYSYKATYEWTDNVGQLHTSAPSTGDKVTTHNLIQVVGDTTSGSAVLKNVFYNTYYIKTGMLLSGTNIPANTYVTDYTPDTITMSANATGSATGVNVVAVTQDVKSFIGNPQFNYLTFANTIANGSYFYVVANGTYGATSLTVRDASLLKKGYTLNHKNLTTPNSIIGRRATMTSYFSGTGQIKLTNWNESANLPASTPLVSFKVTTLAGVTTYTQSPGAHVGYITDVLDFDESILISDTGTGANPPTGWGLDYPFIGVQGEVPFGVVTSGYEYQITSIVGNEIFLNSPLQASYADTLMDVSLIKANSVTTGRNWFLTSLDNVDTLAPDISINVGDTLYSTGFTPNYVTVTARYEVISPYQTRIEISGVTNTTSTITWQKVFKVDHYVKVGNSISGSALTGTGQVTGVMPEFNQITVDQDIQNSSTANYIISNQYGVALSLPTLRLTNKPNYSPIISVWRTLLNGTNYQRVTRVDSPIYNNKNTDYVSFTDNVPDVVLQGNDYIYTTGGVVENICMPATSNIISYRNRLVALTEENPYTIWYSKQVIPNTPVQFSDLFVINVDQKGGPITGLGVMDDKLIIFKRSMVFYMVGDGPTPTGINNDFTNPILITTDSGCTDYKSIVTTPVGLMYKSDKGIYLLDRALDVKYVGADVEGFNSNKITSSNLVSNYNHVRFTLDNGKALLYDYYVQQWSIFTNYSATDACVIGFGTTTPLFYMIKTDGTVNKETNGQFLDNGNYIPLKITTNWISLGGLQGYKRVYKVLVLGHYLSPHTLTFKSYFDFDDTAEQTTNITVNSDPGIYQYRVNLDRQKCESIKFTLEDSELTPAGEGYYLSAIGFEVGIKKGLNKMPASASYG